MLKKTITYTDYNGLERTEDFYFNISKAELTELQVTTEGGYSEMLQRIIDAKDAPMLYKMFKELVLLSYGEKSLDGKYFRKSEEISTAFSQTEAYTQLMDQLATDATFAADFANGVLPANLQKQALKAAEQDTVQPLLAEV